MQLIGLSEFQVQKYILYIVHALEIHALDMHVVNAAVDLELCECLDHLVHEVWRQGYHGRGQRQDPVVVGVRSHVQTS